MNALVITAPPKIMRQIMSVVDRLDMRRAQVLIEAILVEVSTSRAAELGVNWAIGSQEEGSTVPIGTFNQPVGGSRRCRDVASPGFMPRPGTRSSSSPAAAAASPVPGPEPAFGLSGSLGRLSTLPVISSMMA